MSLPEALYKLIVSYKEQSKQIGRVKARYDLARAIISCCPQYIDCISEKFKVLGKGNFKNYCKQVDNKLRNNVDKTIKLYNLEEYRDIIMKNYTLSVSNFMDVANYVYIHTNDILKTLDVICKLGYPRFENISGNGDRLFELMNAWVDFSTQKGYANEDAKLLLLSSLEDMDTEDCAHIFDIKKDKGLKSFFPFTLENVDKLVDYILKIDDFDTARFKAEIDIVDLSNHDIKIRYDTAYYSVLCNYYVYIFNKLNNDYPFSAFTVCAYSKWLISNISIVSRFMPELSSNEIRSLLYDYSLDKYGNISPIGAEFTPLLERDKFVKMMYKLYYKSEISRFELTDVWAYSVINRSLTYSNYGLQETAAILKVKESEYSDSGSILLPWKYVRYVNGKAFFYHPNHERGASATLPFKFEFDKAQESFMNINKSIIWNFPFIPCQAENGHIIGIDERFARYVISKIDCIQKTKQSIVTAFNSSTATAKDILLRYKSRQFCFLKNKQLKQYEILPVLEDASNAISEKEEPALLFTIGVNRETYTLVYENASISRATYVFIVERNSYKHSVKKIISFFSSKKRNKRTELRYSRDMFNKYDGFLRVIRVVHDNYKWELSINFYTK